MFSWAVGLDVIFFYLFLLSFRNIYLTPAHQRLGQDTLPPAFAPYHGPTDLKKHSLWQALMSQGEQGEWELRGTHGVCRA